MPKQKDLKRIIRTRMQKTGESYTAARMHIVKLDYSLAGMSDERVQNATGHTWREWVELIDANGGKDNTHRDRTTYVSSLGTPDWWSQMVVVGYERIRGLRAHGQRMDQTWEVSRSRTFNVALSTLFDAVADENQRAQWLTGIGITRAASTKNKSVRLKFDDGTNVDIRFTAKGDHKTLLALGHMKLQSKDIAEQQKLLWTTRLDALNAMLA